MANTLKLYRNGGVGFIDWVGSWVLDPYVAFPQTPDVVDVFRKAFDEDDFAIPHRLVRYQPNLPSLCSAHLPEIIESA